ncbi:MAG: sigma-54-dependent Fis family transcriptional regulator [Ottowia sp.]|nr:sigma-54-dependent Fis family transcriptional regulator [Ottowia sp.]
MKKSGTDPAPRVLVVDDEPDLRNLYELSLVREGYQILSAGSVAEARALLAEQSFDVLITDMNLPDGQGLELLHDIARGQRRERSIVITAYGSAENAVESLKSGAFDYLTKPVDLKQFRAVVRAAVFAPEKAAASAAAQPAAAAPQPAVTDTLLPGGAGDGMPDGEGGAALARIVGESPAMQTVKQRIVKVARGMAPVLVRGESGTGKELVARAIHDCSHRASGPFIPVNCGAIPESLLEAEFFGARKGSYTGAVQDREGFFQAAHGGTLFLDEIGELPLSMQAKLLRAIQERRVRPLGATQEEDVDVRIVSATHRDLAAGVRSGRFRQDLYYRLNVIEIIVPPLRERREDIPALVHTLLARIARDTGSEQLSVSGSQMRELSNAQLPGNVRELENLLYRAVALGEAGDSNFGVVPEDELATVPPPVVAATPVMPAYAPPPAPAAPVSGFAPASGMADLPADLDEWLKEREREVLLQALQSTGFNRTAAAAKLGMNLRQIRYRMSRLGIVPPGGEQQGEE